MNRLVQGDVGSGKTVVAVMALCMAAENDCQGAFMVPTEVLANQHYRELKKLLEPLDIPVVLLSGAQKTAEKREVKKKIAKG